MAEELSAGITVLREEQLPEGVTVSDVPETPQQAISFTLIPEEAPQDVPARALPRAAVQREPAAPFPRPPPKDEEIQPAPAPKETPSPTGGEAIPPTAAMLKHYRGVVEEAGAGDYLGVVWADNAAHAQKLALASFGGTGEDFLIDQWNNAPKAFFIIRKPAGAAVSLIGERLPAGAERLAVPELKIVPTWTARCPVDLSAWEVSVEQEFFRCPIDGSILRRPALPQGA